jgi:hypothetical protein
MRKPKALPPPAIRRLEALKAEYKLVKGVRAPKGLKGNNADWLFEQIKAAKAAAAAKAVLAKAEEAKRLKREKYEEDIWRNMRKKYEEDNRLKKEDALRQKQEGHWWTCLQETAGGSAPTPSVDGGDGGARGHCWICLEGNRDYERGSAGAAGGSSVGPLLHQGCGCRGAAGFAHLPCLVDYAARQPRSGDLLQCKQCRTCGQSFTGDMRLGLAQAHWEMVQGLPAEAVERRQAMNRLALALQLCSGDHEAARPLLEECLAVARRVGGDEHPNTLAAITNLASLHQVMGHLEQALALGTEALAVKRRTLGSEHPDTLLSINNLASTHVSARNYDLAMPLCEEALDVRRRTLGDQHVGTLDFICKLAVVRAQMGELAEAVTLLREAVTGRRLLLGEEHPQTRQAVDDLWRVSEALVARKPQRGGGAGGAAAAGLLLLGS